MLTIYGSDTFNTTKVVFTAEELGIDYNYVRIDLTTGDQKKPEHMQRHPLGKTPALDHDGNFVFESNVICRYLTRITKSDLYPDNPLQQAHIDQWMDMMVCHVGRWLGQLYYQEFIKVNFFKTPPDESALEEARTFLEMQLPALEKQLSENKYITGADFSLADIIAFCYFTTHEHSSFEIQNHPSINKWYSEIEKRPAYERTKRKMA